MKKILCLALCALMIFSFCACNKGSDNATGQAPSGIVGTWTIEKADYKDNSDPMAAAMVSILKERFAKGMEIEFKEGGKATVGEAEVDYSVDGNLLTITWENNKNFIFNMTENGNKIDLVVDNVLDAAIVRK